MWVLRSLKSFTVHAESTTDEVLDSGQKIQFGSTVKLKARLPDRLRMDVKSDSKERELYYDGKTVTQYAPRLKYYASVPTPGTVRETLVVAASKYDLTIPLADLFFWATDKASLDDITCWPHEIEQEGGKAGRRAGDFLVRAGDRCGSCAR